MREYLNDDTKAKFDSYLRAAVKGGCDIRQAEAIAKERTLFDVMRASACIAANRSNLLLSTSNREFKPGIYRGPTYREAAERHLD